MNALAMQVAFVYRLVALVFAATAYRQKLVLSGVHDRSRLALPAVIFLYGMWQFGVLAQCC